MIELTEEILKTKILNKESFIIDFYATWCKPCIEISKNLNDLKNEFQEINFYKSDIDVNFKLAEEFKIKNIPTILFFEKGVLKDKKTGNIPKHELKQLLKTMGT